MTQQRLDLGLAAALGTALVAGCGSPHSFSGPTSPETVTVSTGPTAPVQVRLLQVGGPSNAKPRPIVGGQVQAIYVGGQVARPYTQTTDANGRATFDLRPGRYVFDGRESTADHFYCRTYAPPTVISGNSEQPPMIVTVSCVVP